MNKSETPVVSRFAPSPTGRMHLGNLFTALMSWLVARKNGGKWILRIEDLDPQRSRLEYAQQIEDDLLWLGLEWDEGGIDGTGGRAPYMQSLRSEYYESALRCLESKGLVYPCYCTKADILSTQAPHASDGRIIYPGTCRPEWGKRVERGGRKPAFRLKVDGNVINFEDEVFGAQSIDLSREFGDFILRRADGAWAYQLAVTVDDAAMGVTHVVRGCDLLESCAPQIYLCGLLGLHEPDYLHLPLICNESGIRLSKRDASLGMAELRLRYTPQRILGCLAYLGGIISDPDGCSAQELVRYFDTKKIPAKKTICGNML
ncbi:tRNA glutamyl-Q(34) synthetase GluQRS [Muribaculaceae bacterium Isolate-104 (HZI)]|nr:tRNA glutamyl-Q(34) synthetase GluQRS [Muribaculaceae bacterium Isolate-104 (HZI)]